LAKKKIYKNQIELRSKLAIDLSLPKVYLIADVPYDQNHWTRTFNYNDNQLYVARVTQNKYLTKNLQLVIESNSKIDPFHETDIIDKLTYELGLNETMKSLKAESKKDYLLDIAIKSNPGFRLFANHNAIEVAILTIISQNTGFFYYLDLVGNFISEYGKSIPWDKKLKVFPTNEVLSEMDVDSWKKLKLGYKADFLGKLTQEDLKSIEIFSYYPVIERGLRELKKIRGIGDYTARILITYHSRRYDYPLYDTYVRDVLQHKYGIQRFNNMKDYDSWINKKWKNDPALILHALMVDFLPEFMKTND